MANEILRKAEVLWEGDLKNGKGSISTESQALYKKPYAYETRFEDTLGTNPEELIAAAHAGCFSMALASTLRKKGYEPKQVNTNATCTLTAKEGGGFEITRMELHVRGEVGDIDLETFKEIVSEADQGCPVSNLLRCGLEIQFEVELYSD